MSVRFTVVVEQVRDPIRGTIATTDGSVSRPFRGWLDLAAGLEAVLAAAEPSIEDQDVGGSGP